MRPKVSIVIPIFKAEAYIERCARSLFEQSLDNIEYIFVNDCSPDNSMYLLNKVLGDYPQRKEQVHIINHSQNLGAAKAREVGIKVATGEYIIHCDSDDWVERNMYQTMYEEVQNHNADIVICDFYETDGIRHKHITQHIDTKSDLLRGLLNTSIKGNICNKLVASYIYKSIKSFPTAHMMEDLAYCIQFELNRTGKVIHLAIHLYYYYYIINSICHQPDESSCLARCQQTCTNIDYIINILKSKGLEAKYKQDIIVLKSNAKVYMWPLLIQDPQKYYSTWRSIYSEINWTYPFVPCVNLRFRIIFFLTVIGIYPNFIHLIRKFTKR